MRWMWIDKITEFEESHRLVAVKNVSLAEEHLHDHFSADELNEAQPIMPASLMIEGMAQTAGILVGSVNRFREKVILAKVVRAEFNREVLPGDTIRYDAEIERIDSKGASTKGIVSLATAPCTEWEEIGRVDLMFSHIDKNMAGVEFPEDNFVFSDNFRTLLSAAGLEYLTTT